MRHRADPRTGGAHYLATALSLMVVIGASACGKDPKPPAATDAAAPHSPAEMQQPVATAPTDNLDRPFNPAKWADYYQACTNTNFPDRYKSSVLRYPKGDPEISLVLFPHGAAYNESEADLKQGRFVGAIRNYLPGTLPEHEIYAGSATAPSKTCVWVEQVPNQSNYQAWYVGSMTAPANPKPRAYERTTHPSNPLQPQRTCTHSIPAAAWYPKGMDATYGCGGPAAAASPVFATVVEPADRLMLNVFLYTLWFTCDLTGCCKNA